jgi:hypothetical protein
MKEVRNVQFVCLPSEWRRLEVSWEAAVLSALVMYEADVTVIQPPKRLPWLCRTPKVQSRRGG